MQNDIISHVRSKIVDAHKNKKTFRVIICIPLLPEFAGMYIRTLWIPGHFGIATSTLLQYIFGAMYIFIYLIHMV